jgi:hypothetical protein
MALDYAPALASHDAQRKIGIITEATILPLRDGGHASSTGQIAVNGYLFAHDFPDVVHHMRAQQENSLGMSYEIADANVPHQEAHIWTVTAFTFTGAAVLRRDKAAYPQTWIALGSR